MQGLLGVGADEIIAVVRGYAPIGTRRQLRIPRYLFQHDVPLACL